MQLRNHRKNPLFLILSFAALSFGTLSHPAIAQVATEQSDKYLWLEDVNGDRAMAWV